MFSFLWKSVVLLILWSAVWFARPHHVGSDTLFIFVCALSFAIYYLINIFQKKWIVYSCLFLLLQLYICFVPKQILIYLFIILCFFLVECSQTIKLEVFRKLVICVGLVNIVIGLFFQPILGFLFFAVHLILLICLFALNEKVGEYKQLREMYDGMLGDLRLQKRQSFKNEQIARMEERTKIAREMHDSVGHHLTALLMKVETLAITYKQAYFSELKEMVTICLEETRRAVRMLEKEEIQGVSSILPLIKRFESENNILIHFTMKQGVLNLPLTNNQSVILYRTIQEGITNAMKYANSRHVTIILGVSAIGWITFEMRNDFKHNHIQHEGFGIKNCRQRLEEIQGKLHTYKEDKQFVMQGTIPVGEK